MRLLVVFAIEAVHAADEAQVFRGGEAAEKREAFGDDADLALDFEGMGGEVEAEKLDVARGGREQPGHHFDGGGFAGSIGSEEAEELTRSDVEGDVIDRGEGAEAAGEVADGDGGRIHWRQG